MAKAIVRNYNEVVSEDDTCYILGDIAMISQHEWEQLARIVKKLNGTKHLILGNHDQFRWEKYLDVGFTSIHSALWFDEEDLRIVMAHDPSVYCALAPASVLLCAHVHTLFKSMPEQRVVNVGVDVWDFRPINMKQIKEELRL
jgi:calcineurin-like phosphoesterase family protein